MTDAQQSDEYFAAGAARAMALGNRGPLKLDGNGQLAPDIVEAIDELGFYVFEGLLDSAELAELDTDLDALLSRTPHSEGAAVDRLGRALDPEASLPQLIWSRPLGDPWGGTKLLNGRHPVRMEEPEPDVSAPSSAIFLMLGLFECMPSALRLSAHPAVLQIAEAVCGQDFVPYNDSIFLKEAGLGGATAWHQDGTTHWDSPAWHPLSHGVNFMAQLRRTTPENALWTIPGTHRTGRVDLRARVADNGGSTRLPDAVPMLCDRGDVAVQNRQCVHGAFANNSADPRITFVWGFFPRASVQDVEVEMPRPAGGLSAEKRRYTDDVIMSRTHLVQLAIDARHDHRREETPYEYALAANESLVAMDAAMRAKALRGYARGTIFV